MSYRSKRNLNSAEQLKQDFSNYPPRPLPESNAIKNVNFNILYQGKIRRFFNAALTMLTMLSNSNSKKSQQLEDEFAIVINSMVHQLRLLKEQVKQPFIQLLDAINSKNLALRLLLKVAVILVIILLLPILLLYAVYSIFKLLFLITKKLGRSYGYYSILPKQVPVVFFNTDNIGKLKVSHDAAISHEHIHVLQHCIGIRVIGSVDVYKHRLFADSILVEKDKGDAYIHYLMRRDETEARLHEIVLSYYRLKHNLPTNYQEFLEFICSFSTFYNFFDDRAPAVTSILNEDFYPIDELEFREWHFVSEFFCILFAINSEEMLTRYALEVMPMLYSNLLLLYSNETIRNEFIKTIPCTDMYHQLYPRVT